MTPRAPKLGIPGARNPAPFSIRDAIKRADEAFNRPPLRDHIERPKPAGQCRNRFALPLPVCQPQNRTRHAQPWKLGKMKSECLALMRTQLSTRPTSPLPGRPQVLCVRFSSVEPDAFADWAKVPVDCLKKLGLIVDDKPSAIELKQWWEPSPPKAGFCVIEVWSGQP
jgi:hypothetical protein